MKSDDGSRRILLVDDNPAIHEDFRKILCGDAPPSGRHSANQAAFLGKTPSSARVRTTFQLDAVLQGEQALEQVRQALAEQRPYELAFVDMRMPPGWDGLETITRLWQLDPEIEMVICTAHSDYTWEETLNRLQRADHFIVLKKPFDIIEVRQLAESLTQKWRLARQERRRFRELEEKLHEHRRDLQAMRAIDCQLESAQQTAQAFDAAGNGSRTASRRFLEKDLRRALQACELTVHYQPLVEIASRCVVGLEALVRWQHPTRGLVAPGEFIPLAEETGLIVPLGEFVLRSVCRQVAQWQREAVPVVLTAVNLSALQLECQSIQDVVRDALRTNGLQPQQLALELTESAIMRNPRDYATALQELRDDGVRIEIDDFGTGYSSLSYLKSLPVDVLKIDRSFIGRLEASSADEAIVGAILALARGLGLQVIAEGVETVGQLSMLARHGCEIAQGYYFSRPLPPEDCRELLMQLAQRASFTDTLRLRMLRAQDGPSAASCRPK